MHTIRVLAIAVFTILAAQVLAPATIAAEVHEIKMYTKDPNDNKKRNVFDPLILRIQPGDTVKFVASDKSHNTETIKGMIPDGAEGWKSKINKDFEVTLETPGVYGYKCTPHWAMGMVGLIIVEGEGWDSNLEAAKAVKQRGKARKEFEAIWGSLEAS